jgi:curved DNA-binding protein CbpA
MESHKSYYAILGILPSAEPVVIAAAYRALAKKYHPDSWTGDRSVAETRMREINEAYETLSNDAKRAQYNRRNQDKFEDYEFDEDPIQSAFDDAERAQESDWQVALEYYPDLADLAFELRRTSKRLEFAFQSMMLETKRFPERREIARQLTDSFLRTYFGENTKIIDYAKSLIKKGHKQAARELNRAVFVLGKSLEPAVVISRIQTKHFGYSRSTRALAETLVHSEFVNDAVALVEALNGEIKHLKLPGGGLFTKVVISVQVLEEKQIFANEFEMTQWVIKNIVPKVMLGGEI